MTIPPDPVKPPPPPPDAAQASANLMNQQLGLIASQLSQIEANVKHTRDSQVVVLLTVAVAMGATAMIVYRLGLEVKS